MATLEIATSNETSRTLVLRKGKTTIGRGPENDVMLNDIKVSRNHAQLEISENQCTILDLKSRNGTFLEEAQLLPGVPEIWSPGKLLHIGSYVLRLSLSAAPDAQLTQGMDEHTPSVLANQHQPIEYSALAHEAALQVTVEPEILHVEMNTVTTAKLTVVNGGKRVEHLLVAVDGIPADWLSGARPVIELFPSAQSTTQLTLQPQMSPLMKPGALPISVRVYSEDGQTQAVGKATLMMTGQMQPTAFYDLVIFPAERSGVQAGAFQIQLTNRGQTNLPLTLTVTDMEQVCRYTIEQPRLNLLAGQEQTIRLLVQANKPLPGRTPRAVLFTVAAEHPDWPQLTRRAHGTWTQIPPAFEVELDAHTRSGTLRGVYQVRLGNRSEGLLTLQLVAKDMDGKLKFELDATEVSVPAGEDRTVELVVQPLKPITGPDAVSFPFTVSAYPAGASQLAQRVDGVWQRVAPSFTVMLTPTVVAAPRRAQFRIEITNQSPGSFIAHLEVTNNPQGCTFTLANNQVKIPRDTTGSTTLTGQARGLVVLQNRVHFPFTVTVWAAQNPEQPQTISGEYRQTRHWGCVGWLVVGLALLYLLFLFMSRT